VRKTPRYRLFGRGRTPARWRERLDAEGIRVLEEGVRIRVTYRNDRAPGKRLGYRRSIGSGAIAQDTRGGERRRSSQLPGGQRADRGRAKSQEEELRDQAGARTGGDFMKRPDVPDGPRE